MLELVLILVTINTRIVIKEMFLNIMIMFIMYKMGEVKQINIKNRTYYFYYDIINLKTFGARLLKIDKKSYKKHWYLQHRVYRKEKNWWLWKYLHCVNPLYLFIDHANGYLKKNIWILRIWILIMQVDILNKKA